MSKSFKASVPRYLIESVNGDYFDIYNKKINAIQAAIDLAIQYPGVTFVVVKKILHKRTIIFRYALTMQAEFADLKNVYNSIIKTYQNKLDKMKYWREADEHST